MNSEMLHCLIFQTTDPVINKENDELILKEDKTLAQSGIGNVN